MNTLWDWIKKSYLRLVDPVADWLVRWRVHPNTITIFGTLCTVAGGVIYGTGHIRTAGWFLGLTALFDVLDGTVARRSNRSSTFGAFLDSTLDRFSEVAMFIGLAAFYAETRTATVLIAAGLGGSLLVSYTRARGESVGVVCKAGVMQRAERMLALGFGSIFDPTLSEQWGRPPGSILIYIIWIVALASIGTAIYRTVWISRELRRTR